MRITQFIAPSNYAAVCRALIEAQLWDAAPDFDGDIENMAGLPALYFEPEAIQLLIVAYLNDAPVGVVALGPEGYHPNERDRWPVLHCYVTPARRRDGIGDELLTHARTSWTRGGRPWQILGFMSEESKRLYSRHEIVDKLDDAQILKAAFGR